MELLREAPLRAVQRPVTTDEMLLAEQLARQFAICKRCASRMCVRAAVKAGSSS